MNITDKLYLEWAWRSRTGVPDINNAEDKAILDQLIAEATGADGEVSKVDIVHAINKGDFTPEQLRSIMNSVSGIAYKDDILQFLKQKGKAVTSIATRIYNVFVENGDVQAFHQYITGSPVSYDGLGNQGNLKAKFSKLFSEDTLNFLLDIKPSVGNIATGKGEVFLCVLTSDVNGDTASGDVGVGSKGIEVKNASAIPMGQKAQFGKNTDKSFIQDCIDGINDILDAPLEVSTRGKRPFHRLNIILQGVADQDSSKIDNSLNVIDNALRRNYPGIDFTNFSVKTYKRGNGVDADAMEQEFGKKVIQLYTETEEFEEVLFLNDSSGSFAKVPSSKLKDLVGTKIKIWMKDGLPRWTYNF